MSDHAVMRDLVAPDGSPVAVYLALPAGETPGLIHGAVPRGGSILELGCGPGRITRPLTELGHQVVAVDNSEAMLAHIGYAETVLADLFELDLGRSFDAVVAGSHLINQPDASRRLALLDVCRRHVVPDGVVLIERYDPTWAAAPIATDRRIGPVHIAFEPLAIEHGWFRGRNTYTIDDRTWVQEFTAAAVTDEMLTAEADTAGLRIASWLNDIRTWVQLIPVHAATVH